MSLFGGATSFGGGGFGGQTSQQQQPQTTFFGSSTGGEGSVFGGNQQNSFSGAGAPSVNTGMFGTQPAPSNVFGCGVNNQGFGSSSQNTAAIGFFQNQSQQPTGTSVPLEAVKGTDTTPCKGGGTTQNTIRYQCISVMPYYQGKSLEELRLEDYQLNRHKKQLPSFATGTGIFGSSSIPTPPAPPPQPTTGLFSNALQNLATTSTPGFGGTGLFSQQTNNTTSTAGGGVFGPFGGTSTGSLLTGRANSMNTSTPQRTGMFGQPQQQSTTPGFGFGGTSTTGGTAFTFSSQNQQQQLQPKQQQGFGLFSRPQPVASNVFGSGLGVAALPEKPFFGSSAGSSFTVQTPATSAPASTFGTGSIFGSPAPRKQQSKPSLIHQSAFGSVPASNMFPSNASGTGATTTINLGIPKFSAFTPSSIPGFGVSQSIKQPTVQFLGSFGSTTSAPPSNQFVPRFGAQAFSGTNSFPFQYQLSAVGPVGPITFATTPFKDNKIFYNLLPKGEMPKSSARRKADNQTASPKLIQTFSRRTTGAGPSCSLVSFNISSAPAVRLLTGYNKSKNSSLSKFKTFEGFEEEDFEVGVNVLSTKTIIKTLDLKSLEDSLYGISVPKKNDDKKQSSGLARRSVEILRERKKASALRTSSPQSPLIRNRRVRFTLPSSGGGESEILPSPIHFPGDGDDAAKFGDSPKCYSSFLAQQPQWDSNNESPNLIEFSESSESQRLVACAPPAGSVCGVVNTREGYYLKPSLEEMDTVVDKHGNCFITGLEIGRKYYGRIKFLCPVNIVNLNIDRLVHFRHKEVIVYPDDKAKPPFGQGLNVPAEITLERVWPVDRTTNELIRHVDDNDQRDTYKKKLQKACKRMNAEFLSYDREKGLWKFRIPHF